MSCSRVIAPVQINSKIATGISKLKPKAKSKSRPLVTLDFTDAKGMNEIDNVITPIVEGRVKISVETPKPKRKPKTTK